MVRLLYEELGGTLRTLLRCCGMTILTLAAACSSDTPTEKAHPDSHRTLPQHLTFTGQITGLLSAALNAQGVIKGQPDPLDGALFTQTSCAEYKISDDASPYKGTSVWQADIYGTVDGKKVTLRLDLDDRTVLGEHPISGNHLDENSAQAALDTASNLELNYPVIGSGSTLKVDPGGHSGTVRLALTNSPASPDIKQRVSGEWRCA
jgi:hypothetical protein